MGLSRASIFGDALTVEFLKDFEGVTAGTTVEVPVARAQLLQRLRVVKILPGSERQRRHRMMDGGVERNHG